MNDIIYKTINFLITIYLIAVFGIISLNLTKKFLGCDMYSGDSWDIEHFHAVGLCCDLSCDQNIAEKNIWLFDIWEYQMKFTFFVFNFCSIFVLSLSILNLAKDFVFIQKNKLSVGKLFKRVYFYGLIVSLIIILFVIYNIFFGNFSSIFYLNLF